MTAKLQAFLAALFAILIASASFCLGGQLFSLTHVSAMGPLTLILSLALPWLALHRLKSRFFPLVRSPENAVGGLVVGLAAIFWILIGAGEFGGPLPWWLFLILFIAMAIGATLAAALLESDRTAALLLGAPIVALVVIFAIGMIGKYTYRPTPQDSKKGEEIKNGVQQVLEEQGFHRRKR